METKGKTAERISDMILEKVNEQTTDIANWRGLANKNEASMSGK